MRLLYSFFDRKMNEQLNQFHMMNQPQAMMNRSYGLWPQQNPSQILRNPNFNVPNQSMAVRNNWKGKNKVPDNRKSGGVGYKPPTLQELQSQNRLKARRFYHPKKKFNNRSAPYAPRNTTSFIIRAKKAGGIASLVSPCPVTPAVLPTPVLSPSTEVLGDMAKEEWGVDGYGTMNGLIRLRDEAEVNEEEEEEGGGSSDSDVEEHVEVERRLDHDLSRFEMIYPNSGGLDYNHVLENRVDDRDAHILQLEEENLTLKEKLFLMGREMEDLKRRLLRLERRSQGLEDANEEVVENESESESGDRDDNATMRENNDVNNKDVVNNENVVNHKDAVKVNNGEVTNKDVAQMKEDNNNEAADSSDLQMEELASVRNEVIAEEDRVQG